MAIKNTFLKKYPEPINSLEASHARKTVMTFLKRDLNNLKNKKVLEAGCGRWDYAKNILEINGNEWIGIDPVDFGNENITPIKGSVKKMPFHDNSFDIVLCNQTMEHWFEYNVSLKQALREMNRVLKKGGVLMVNAPIHLHGDPRFLSGNIKKIRASFKKSMWKVSLFERVYPTKKTKDWKKISAKGFFSHFGYPSFLINNSKEARTHQINIHAVKISTSSKRKNAFSSFRPFFVILRFVKTYFKSKIVFS